MITDQMKAEGWIEHDGGPVMSDLVERINTAVTYGYMPRQMREVASEAAARITELETALAEAEGRVIAEVVKWLRDRMRQAPKDEFSQAACDVIFVLVAALETGEWKDDPDAETGCADDRLPGTAEHYRTAARALADPLLDRQGE